MNDISILGVRINNLSMDDAIEESIRLSASCKGAYAVTPNTEIVLAAQKDDELMNALNHADLSIPDSIGVIAAGKILGTPFLTRVPGYDFACRMLSELDKRKGSVFFLGGKPGVAERASLKVYEKYPNITICGMHDGYFSVDDAEIIIRVINESSPDFLMVCLGCPKQEVWMYHNAHHLQVGIMAGLGGTLDVLAGDKNIAPQLIRNCGLEWLYRLFKEPKRFGRMRTLPLILVRAVSERLRKTFWKEEN